ncbi:hypothetical protein [Desulfatibacillum aliphaticivorans]|uniref:hypothetical protein n=1 Tax=Desulfatibacillum aliphaticivorans TaxID=218208 RepID=UPI000486224E|nr:hypothetical protein [Desulfatibacillum aliphaticivorans]
MDWKIAIAIAGWLTAIVTFYFNYRLSIKKNEDELLEKTLSYFLKGALARSIGISLVEGIWFKRKVNLEIILPVLVGQATFLLTEADEYSPDSKNLIRLLRLIEKCLPYASNRINEVSEILDTLILATRSEKGVPISKEVLKLWYSKFNNGKVDVFENAIRKITK